MAKSESYDASLDKLVLDVGSIPLGEKAEINVSIKNYNDGGNKVVCTKRGTQSTWSSQNIGRLDEATLPKFIELLQQAHEHMNMPVAPAPVVRRPKLASRGMTRES